MQSLLESWLKFNDDDLASNRDGRLSARQRRRLIASGVWRFVLGPPLVVGGVIVSLLVETAIFALLALTAAGIGLYILWRGFAFVVDASEGDVAFLTSRLGLRVVRGKTTSYYADVGPVTRHISAAAFNALPDRAQVHLYYSPGCRSLLSLEPSSAAEPRPDHAFGPDSAHVWDRLRWSWVLMTIGALGVAAGLHQVTVAHPAYPVAVEGVMTNYVETHGKSTTRTIYMDNGNSYTPQSEGSYDPPAPDWSSLIGQQVTLYANRGTTDVLAVNVEGRLYAGDWYEHPEHETTFDITNGVITTVVAALFAAIGVNLLIRDRRRAEAAVGSDQPDARSARLTPPTVRAPASFTTAAIGVGFLLLLFGGLMGLVFVSMK